MALKSRHLGLDLLRVIACYLVIQVHAGEFYYIGDAGTVLPGDGPHWVNLFNTLGRAAVPLFILITGYFVLPVKDESSVFFKKRFTRVAIPFVLWCILYALYKFLRGETDLQGMLTNILKIPVNFGTEVGHLWYIYMLIGLYLFFPIISPWIKTASRKAINLYLAIWASTLFLPYIHLVFPEVLGECYWNNTSLLYYFSGFLGYAVLGAYLKKYHLQKMKYDSLSGFILLAIGFIVTYWIFNLRLSSQSLVADLELSWSYGTINVALMAIGLFLILKNTNDIKDGLVKNMVTSISNMSYGMYLAHIMVLNCFYFVLNDAIDEVWIKLPLMSVCTFVVSYLIIKIISYLPKSKYIIG